MSHKHAAKAAAGGLAALTTAALLAWGGASAAAAPDTGGRAAPGGIISTVAGGVGGPGPATAISLASDNVPAGACGTPAEPTGVAFAAGRVYIADGSVRQVSEKTGTLTTPAGTGAAGPLGIGGPAAERPSPPAGSRWVTPGTW
jgi:hypothetical protein